MEKASRNCCVRLPPSLHRKAKLEAYKEGKNLQNWVSELITVKLESQRKDKPWLCQDCGNWELKGTQMAMLGKCGRCSKEDVAVFPC